MYKLVVLISIAAMAAAKPSTMFGPLTYSAVVPGYNLLSQYSSSVVYGSPAYGHTVYSMPAVYGSHFVAPVAFSQGLHSPAVILGAVNGVLDTEVVAARTAHYQAKALSVYHHLHKRSVGVAPNVAPLSSAYSPIPASAYPSPLYQSAVYPGALSRRPY